LNVLPSLDVSDFAVPARFVAEIAAFCAAEQGRANELLGVAVPFETEEGQALLVEAIDTHWPELAELAALADPDDPAIARVRAEVFERRVAVEASTMAKGIFAWAASESRKRAEGA